MPPLRPCPHCGRHVLSVESGCPHCHTSLRSGLQISTTATAAAMSLALIACVGEKSNVDYGSAPYTTEADADADSDTDTDSDTDADSDTDTDTDTDTGTATTGHTGP